jgi:hypothetical protein
MSRQGTCQDMLDGYLKAEQSKFQPLYIGCHAVAHTLSIKD